jgi:hypothetical protein
VEWRAGSVPVQWRSGQLVPGLPSGLFWLCLDGLGAAGPGLDTRGLTARSTPLLKIELRAGDLLINPSPNLRGHVVIFERWTDASMTSYLGYAQSGDGGTHHRAIPYPYFGGYPMSPYRLVK